MVMAPKKIESLCSHCQARSSQMKAKWIGALEHVNVYAQALLDACKGMPKSPEILRAAWQAHALLSGLMKPMSHHEFKEKVAPILRAAGLLGDADEGPREGD